MACARLVRPVSALHRHFIRCLAFHANLGRLARTESNTGGAAHGRYAMRPYKHGAEHRGDPPTQIRGRRRRHRRRHHRRR